MRACGAGTWPAAFMVAARSGTAFTWPGWPRKGFPRGMRRFLALVDLLRWLRPSFTNPEGSALSGDGNFCRRTPGGRRAPALAWRLLRPSLPQRSGSTSPLARSKPAAHAGRPWQSPRFCECGNCQSVCSPVGDPRHRALGRRRAAGGRRLATVAQRFSKEDIRLPVCSNL